MWVFASFDTEDERVRSAHYAEGEASTGRTLPSVASQPPPGDENRITT